MRLKMLVCGCLLFFTSLFVHVETAMAQTQDWDTLLANMTQDDPALAAQWEKAKKAAEKNEKDLKKFSDKHFQKSFDTVFGEGSFKPSEGLELLKVLEAASAGDVQSAGEGLSAFIIAKYTPGLGQYITVMKTVASGIKSMEQVWIKGLNQTKAYQNFIEVLYANPNYDRPYIPSYMITYLRNNETFGPQIGLIYDEMRVREDEMFRQWLFDDAAMTQMMLPTWSSRWISARGKVPTEREMFNYFLYELVKNSKAQYLEKFGDYYMEPLIRQEARGQRQKLKQAMRQALTQITAEAGSADNTAQCTAWNEQYKTGMATSKRQKREIGTYLDGVYKTYKNKFNTMLIAENAAFHRLLDPLEREQEALEQENRDLDSLEDEVDSANADLGSIRSEINSMTASLPSDQSDPSYNDGVRQINARIESFNSTRSATYMPAKRAYEEAAKAFNSNNDAFKAKHKAFWDDPSRSSKYAGSQGLVGKFGRIRQSIQGFQSGKFNCRPFAQVAVDDGMNNLIGVDPSRGINMCKTWVDNAVKMNALTKQISETCK